MNAPVKGKKPVGPISSNNSNGNNSLDDSVVSKEPLTSQYKVSLTSQQSKSCKCVVITNLHAHVLYVYA